MQGEHGFWELLTPATVDRFLWTGWYGIGDGPEHGPARLEAILGSLLADRAQRDALGAYARRLVEDRFSLRAAAARQLDLYERALDEAPITPRRWLAPGGASASKLAAYRMRSRIDQVRGRLSADDFNARAVARIAPETPSRTAA